MGLSWEGLALVGALFFGVTKWLLGREIARLDNTLKETDVRLQKLEGKQADQQVEAATIARLDNKVGQLDTDVQQLKQALAVLPKIEQKVDHIEEIRASIGTLNQRFDNLGFALNQTQDLFHQHQKELMGFRTEASRNYVEKEDDTRYKAILDNKMTALWDRVDRLSGSRYREDSQDV
ncbi:MAG: hypothetical protein AAGI44_05940 [Pseudomonadota bacterium]